MGVLHPRCEAGYLARLRKETVLSGDMDGEPAATIVRQVSTPDLKPGDLVIHYGMHIRVPEWPCIWQHKGSTVYGWLGEIENLKEVLLAGCVPISFLRRTQWVEGEGWVSAIENTWSIQGNELASWYVEEPTGGPESAQPAIEPPVDADHITT
ncbi:hypothetical protein [Actinomadura violacea]|uniref:Uncharacterized protein n=1 Tax=Actinomadura violacea TaxID=2819934 RepID=A0ABS3S751_9ACTN|nr:hypothetical protein [Actinomadura violacea]MBO2464035.1 hypothetical protein [Actinomadura violacea]